jgi:hypothetical protein
MGVSILPVVGRRVAREDGVDAVQKTFCGIFAGWQLRALAPGPVIRVQPV